MICGHLNVPASAGKLLCEEILKGLNENGKVPPHLKPVSNLIKHTKKGPLLCHLFENERKRILA
jgi:hypothetical protein